MPTSTYIPLANITLGSSAASVTFSSISQAYRDLILVYSGTGTSGAADEKLQFNSDTGSNYNWVRMYGTGSSTASSSTSGTTYIRNTGGSLTNDANIIIQIFDYSATDKHKTTLGRGNNTGEIVMATAGRWASTSAITTVTYSTSAGSWSAGASFALYGIAS